MIRPPCKADGCTGFAKFESLMQDDQIIRTRRKTMADLESPTGLTWPGNAAEVPKEVFQRADI